MATPTDRVPLERSDVAHLLGADVSAEKRDFYQRMPPLPVPLDRGRVANAWMPKGGQVLDIGCGAGYHVRHFARRAARVVAIDVDPVTLHLARRRVRSSRVTFLRYDGSELPFADASFDTVSMLDVLEHVADRESLVSEIFRVLRPGGHWIVSVPHRGAFAWLSPENLAMDHPRVYTVVSKLLQVRFWVRDHQASGQRHHHFGMDELERLSDGRFEAVAHARRGGLLYGLAYTALCFPPPFLSRLQAWTSACFALMALDYQVPYGPLAYNLIMQFRREAAVPMIEAQPIEAADASRGARSEARGAARAA
ncbi:MAG TPA: class I SAM-dependent methyltransferase [Pirellulales bacterium]|nr:class I SAM-dependent methyltransferase [Pirellulales bacterium]